MPLTNDVPAASGDDRQREDRIRESGQGTDETVAGCGFLPGAVSLTVSNGSSGMINSPSKTNLWTGRLRVASMISGKYRPSGRCRRDWKFWCPDRGTRCSGSRHTLVRTANPWQSAGSLPELPPLAEVTTGLPEPFRPAVTKGFSAAYRMPLFLLDDLSSLLRTNRPIGLKIFPSDWCNWRRTALSHPAGQNRGRPDRGCQRACAIGLKSPAAYHCAPICRLARCFASIAPTKRIETRHPMGAGSSISISTSNGSPSSPIVDGMKPKS